MKKFIILPLVAATALGLAACKPTTSDNASVANDLALNSDAALDSNVTVDETALNGTVADNAVALDSAENGSNATAN